MSRARVGRRAAGAIALGLCSFLAGCDLDPVRACTEIGCSDGLTVEFNQAVPAGTIIEVEDEFGTIRTLECGVDWPCLGGAFFAGFTPETATVRVVTPSGETTQVFEPDYEFFRPNGPGCEPLCEQARVTAMLPAGPTLLQSA